MIMRLKNLLCANLDQEGRGRMYAICDAVCNIGCWKDAAPLKYSVVTVVDLQHEVIYLFCSFTFCGSARSSPRIEDRRC